MRFLKTLLAGLAAALALAAPALAAPVDAGQLELELVAQGEAAPGGETYVALRQKMDPEWHTFWRNPGDAGEATKIAWTLPAGWRAGDIVWPTPERYQLATLINFVYSDEVLLPVPITIPADAAPGQTVTLKADVTYQVCSDTCIPGQQTLSLDLRVAEGAPAVDPRWAPRIAKVLAESPKPSGLAGAMQASPERLVLSFTGEPLKGADFSKAYFYPFQANLINYAEPARVERGPEGVTFTASPGFELQQGRMPERVAGVLDLGDAAYEVEAAAGPLLAGAAGLGTVASAGGGAAPSLPLWQAMAFALLGGLILNLMPCVFPVLSMKAAALAGHAHETSAARAQGLAFLAGVIATFMALAVALIAAKAAGSAAGWGFQLQSPPVIAGLCLLMLLVALNLSGVFEVGVSMQGAGTGLASKRGMAGAFFTGALAVVVAAPCTAPFMAAALGYALAQPAIVALAVFLALAIGFAAPFTILSLSPGLLRRLPRPGAWMSVLKTVLSFPMYGAAAWLAWVFALQVGLQGLPLLFAAALAIAFGAWLFGLGQLQIEPRRRLGLQALLPVAIIGSVALLAPVAKPQTASAAARAADQKAQIPYEPYSPERLAALRSEGKLVFVNFTAAWCVTCQVNEQAALSSRSVADEFAAKGVVYLKGDWTNRDPVIAAALAEHGRVGVPLYLLYDGQGAPVVLPQLLTPGSVKAAVQKAGAGA